MHLLTHAQLLQLKRLNTPTIYNGWEQITRCDPSREGYNLEECHDFMPQMGPMVGYAVTVVIEPSNPRHKKAQPDVNRPYQEYIASFPGPKIVVVQDMDKPRVTGSFWGEVNGNTHRALGCVGTITDGAVRDLDEMTNAGFKSIARRLCVGHAHVAPIRWGCEVEVFGRVIHPGRLIHADKHGFLVIPPEDEKQLFEAACLMDQLECQTVIAAARETGGLTNQQILENLSDARKSFKMLVESHFKH